MTESPLKSQRRDRTRRRRRFLALVLTALAAVALLYALGPYSVRIGRISAPEVVEVLAQDGKPVRLSIWPRMNSSSKPGPAVVFVHGVTEDGLANPLYSLLCDALSRRGIVVVAPWLRGYKGAFRPGDHYEPSSWNPLPDIAAARELLLRDERVDSSRIFVAGHSLGGSYVLDFGLSNPSVAGIISLSRLDMKSRIRHRGGQDWFRKSFASTFGLDAPIPLDKFREFARTQVLTFENVQDALRNSDHPRLLFTLGGLEAKGDHEWLAAYAAGCSGEAEYHEFQQLTHMLNVRAPGPPSLGVTIYEPAAIEKVASKLKTWMGF